MATPAAATPATATTTTQPPPDPYDIQRELEVAPRPQAGGPPSNIVDFYNNRSVLITGASGFIGKVLIEKLLRTCPGVRRIFVLIRPKWNKQPDERLSELLEAPLFEGLRLSGAWPDRGAAMAALQARVQLVEGDVTQPNLGLSEQNLLRIMNEVSVIFHSAATVKFDEPLKLSVAINIKGTKNMIDVCRRIPQLAALVHVSTAYANCQLPEVDEHVYPVENMDDPERLIKMADWLDQDTLQELKGRLLGPRPNTYTYTKALAEWLLVRSARDLPVVVCRPSIVVASWREPFTGWIDNVNGPTGVLLGAGKGLVRSMFAEREFVADLVPVDTVINMVVTLGWFAHVYKSSQLHAEAALRDHESLARGLGPATAVGGLASRESSSSSSSSSSAVGSSLVDDEHEETSSDSLDLHSNHLGSDFDEELDEDADQDSDQRDRGAYAEGAPDNNGNSDNNNSAAHSAGAAQFHHPNQDLYSMRQRQQQQGGNNNNNSHCQDEDDSYATTEASSIVTDSSSGSSTRSACPIGAGKYKTDVDIDDEGTAGREQRRLSEERQADFEYKLKQFRHNTRAKLMAKHLPEHLADIPVFHCTSGCENPITWGRIQLLVISLTAIFPSVSTYRYPNGSFTNSHYLDLFYRLTLHYLPAYLVDFCTRLVGGKPILVRIFKKIDQAAHVLKAFTSRQWRFDYDNKRMLMEHFMTQEDRRLFNCDISTLNWDTFFIGYILGVRKFLLKEPMSNLRRAKWNLTCLYYRNLSIQLLLLAGLLYYVANPLWLVGTIYG